MSYKKKSFSLVLAFTAIGAVVGDRIDPQDDLNNKKEITVYDQSSYIESASLLMDTNLTGAFIGYCIGMWAVTPFYMLKEIEAMVEEGSSSREIHLRRRQP